MTDTENQQQDNNGSPTWCPEQQIYVGGVVPENKQVEQLLKENDDGGSLSIFGYGSLCWSPGTGALAKEGVTTTLGRAIGYKRCWAQKSADHRGTPDFPGIVCTLLKDEEVQAVRALSCGGTAGVEDDGEHEPSTTEGVLYHIPPDQVRDCLAELDFREKGGYARDVIEVREYESHKTIKALLYRGTLDNPMFWPRALLDKSFAASIMSVAIGPSGNNDVYLFHLDDFMHDPDVVKGEEASPSEDTASWASVKKDEQKQKVGDTDTSMLSTMAKALQKQQLFFLFGCGSNQHNQLLLDLPENAACLVNGEDAQELKEMVVCTSPLTANGAAGPVPKKVLAGGGHSGLLTDSGHLFLWGWNEHGQLGRSTDDTSSLTCGGLPVLDPVEGLLFEDSALGFSHTLAIEKDTGRLLAFGDNARGQVGEHLPAKTLIRSPTTPNGLRLDETFVKVSAGLFHSAAVSQSGDLITFGCSRFGQSLVRDKDQQVGRWRPPDGSRVVDVACGRRHTVILDDNGRVWTMGENKYGQLGRSLRDGKKTDAVPRLVDSVLGTQDSGCVAVAAGWSHAVASVRGKNQTTSSLYGWGRNDKGQLGTGGTENVAIPTRIFETVFGIDNVSCGSESTVALDRDGGLWGTGWNEHGNLATGDEKDVLDPSPLRGARLVGPPPTKSDGPILFAAGGGHVIAMRT